LSTEPDGNFEKQSNEPGDVDDASPVLKKLQARFGNRDGVGMIPERLGPQEIQWLACWFMSCGQCGGCGGGDSLEFIAPIFDSKIDLWGRKHLALAPSRRAAIDALSSSLFAHGLNSALVMRDQCEDSATFDELLLMLKHYNHADCSEGRMDQIDPSGFSSTWPMKWMLGLQKLYPSLLLTMNALKRIGAENPSPVETAQMQMLPNPPKESRTLPAGSRIFFFAGAIAGGVTPGCAGQPFPVAIGTEQQKQVQTEEDECPPF